MNARSAGRGIYLDHAAGSPLDPRVFELMRPFFEDGGNAASSHRPGRRAAAAVEEARAELAALIGADPEEIVFTSGGTEADNWAVWGGLEVSSRTRLAVSAVEHSAVLQAAERAAKRRGTELALLPVDSEGRLLSERAAERIGPETALVSVMLANNEVGTRQPVEELAALAEVHGTRLHVDAVAAAGKLPIDVRALGADFLSLSAHKFAGPPGVGALFIRRGALLAPLFVGGGQERNRRPGTLNVPGIVGMGAAARLVRERLAIDREGERERALIERLYSALAAGVPRLRRNGPREAAGRLPGLLNLAVEGVLGEALVAALDRRGVAVSAAAACRAGKGGASHVLTAMGQPLERAIEAVRISVGFTTTEEDIDRTIAVFPQAVEEAGR